MQGAADDSTGAVITSSGKDRKKVGEGSLPPSTPAKHDKSKSGPAIEYESWDPCADIPNEKRRGWRALSGRNRSPTDPRNEAALKELANHDSFRQLVCLSRERFNWVKRMQGYLEDCCKAIKVMSYVSFVFGWALILVPLALFFYSGSHDTNLLWFSGIGLAETLAILVYRPIDRVQEATSDMAQGTLIMSSWATEIGLILYLTDLTEVKKEKKISDLVDLISKATGDHVDWFQRYTETKNQIERGEKRPDKTDKKTPAKPEPQQPTAATDPNKREQPESSQRSHDIQEDV